MTAVRSTGAAGPPAERLDGKAEEQASPPRGLKSRLGWFVLLYLASAVVYAAAVYGLRMLVPHP